LDRLYDKLVLYCNKDYYPMHMPGHKRNTGLLPMGNPYGIDITEIYGFDNLHQPEGILKALCERISIMYHAQKSYALVNGSTVGILTAISASLNRGDKILVARNCHKSVYNAIIQMELRPYYIYPEQAVDIPINCGISAKKTEEMLINIPDIKLVVITSPTYEGVVSDISAIAATVHRHGAVLLVDEAHGAHLGFNKYFPESAVTLGADLVVQSLHKTLPSFTQTAVLHCNLPELNHKIEHYLNIYQSSSPSYILMAGIDRCISLLEDQGTSLFKSFHENLINFYKSMQELTYLRIPDRHIAGRFSIFDLDPSKITISVKNTPFSGHQMNEILRMQYHIEMEMEANDYVLAITSICDTKEGFERLEKALHAIDREMNGYCYKNDCYNKKEANYDCVKTTAVIKNETDKSNVIGPVQVITPFEAIERKTELLYLSRSNGRVCASLVGLYPPGSPLIVPGEMIEEDLIKYLDQAKREGLTVSGLYGENYDKIEVVTDIF
jgi:arginine decarboxylase